ncbi:MAG: trypsin-like peptidase domain-containing protein [Cypionkella sp.]
MFRSLALVVALALPAAAETVVPQGPSQITLSFAPVVKATAPSVVNIFTTKMTQTRQSPFAGDPFFDQFFQGMGNLAPQAQNALGSGIIVSPDGIVLSNNHVIDGADEIRVVLNDRREYAAKVLLAEADADLAVLQLQGAHDLPAIRFDDSDALQVGDLVLAIGNPFGVGQTVSSGIVSGLARSALQVGNGKGYFVQTDAPINPGNSGGALVDMSGGLIGINTAILSQGGGSNGIGFAIPANLAAAVVKQAEAGATHFTRPWAGISAQEVDAATAEAAGLPVPEGLLIADVASQSPFAKAGVIAGDVLLQLGGQPVNSAQEMTYRLAILGTDAAIPITWSNNGTQKTATVTLTTPPDTPKREAMTISEDVVLRGLSLSRINPAVAAEMNLPLDAAGVVVTAAEDYAARIGLTPGDILLKVNGAVVARPDDVLKAAQQNVSLWQIDILRQGRKMRLRFRL